jgi:hypothetical protein
MGAQLEPALLVIVLAAIAVWLAIPIDYPDLAARRRTKTTTTHQACRGARHRRSGGHHR